MNEQEVLAIVASISLDSIEEGNDNKYDFKFKEDFDILKLPTGHQLSKEEKETYFYFLVPTTSWNLIQEKLKKQLNEDDRRFLGTARAFRVPQNNVVSKKFNNYIKLLIKVDPGEYDPKRHEFTNTLYLGYCSRCYKIKEHTHHEQFLNSKEFPLVIITQKLWDLFQGTLDKFQIRENVRQCRPVAFSIKNKEVFKTTHEEFEKIKEKHQEV